jgi:hypothetical protein
MLHAEECGELLLGCSLVLHGVRVGLRELLPGCSLGLHGVRVELRELFGLLIKALEFYAGHHMLLTGCIYLPRENVFILTVQESQLMFNKKNKNSHRSIVLNQSGEIWAHRVYMSGNTCGCHN